MSAQARPSTSKKNDKTYGMPSSHANSLFYFVALLSIAAFFEYTLWWMFLTGSSLLLYTMTVLYCRVEIDRDHTWSQVIVGGIIGSLVGSFTVLYIIPNASVDLYLTKLDYKHYLRILCKHPEIITMSFGLILLRSGQKFVDFEDNLDEENDSDDEYGEVMETRSDKNDGQHWGLWKFCVVGGEIQTASEISNDNYADEDFDPKKMRTPLGRSNHVSSNLSIFSLRSSKNKSKKNKSGKQIVQEAHAGWCNDITNILFCCCFCKPHSFVEGIVDEDA